MQTNDDALDEPLTDKFERLAESLLQRIMETLVHGPSHLGAVFVPCF
jgi:hypothetical protein